MTDSLLDDYHAVEACSQHMLEAATAADWAAFAVAEMACAGQIAQLRRKAASSGQSTGGSADFSTPWGPAQAAQKHAILLRILRHDAHIRQLRQLNLPACAPLPGTAGLLH